MTDQYKFHEGGVLQIQHPGEKFMSRGPSPVIIACLDLLADILGTALKRVNEAQDAIKRGQQNEAIGALCTLGDSMSTAASLFGTILAVHREGSKS